MHAHMRTHHTTHRAPARCHSQSIGNWFPWSLSCHQIDTYRHPCVPGTPCGMFLFHMVKTALLQLYWL
jgi:hypothetical protein